MLDVLLAPPTSTINAAERIEFSGLVKKISQDSSARIFVFDCNDLLLEDTNNTRIEPLKELVAFL